MEQPLFERKALVTGSTSGIGREIAKVLSAAGAHVVVTGRRRERGEAVVSEILSNGGQATFIEADLIIADEAENLVSQCASSAGGLDIVINNAGIVPRNKDGTMADGPIHRTEFEYWERIWQADLRSVLLINKFAIPHLLKSNNACIINISSVHGVTGCGMDIYSAIKGAVLSLTKSMALSYAHRIRVNCITPGMVLVERTQALWEESAEVQRQYHEAYLTRIGRPNDIAQMCLFLASVQGEYVTGADFRLDGGMSVHGWFPPSPMDTRPLFQVTDGTSNGPDAAAGLGEDLSPNTDEV